MYVRAVHHASCCCQYIVHDIKIHVHPFNSVIFPLLLPSLLALIFSHFTSLIPPFVQLKATYREQYDSLQAVQQEVLYCSQYVEQSREKLLEEFEKWYRASFVGESVEQEKGREEVSYMYIMIYRQ